MVIAKVTVSGTHCVASEIRKIPAGIVGAKIEVKYDAQWKGLTKTAVFAGVVTKDVLNAGDVIEIPAEVVAKSGHRLRVGFYGVLDNTLAIPTLWADLGNIQSATDPSGDSSTDPSLPIWAQLQEEIKNIELTPGPPGPAGKDGVDGQPGKDGYTPVKGKDYFDGDDYVITDEDKDEIADIVLSSENIVQMQKDIADLKESGENGLPEVSAEDNGKLLQVVGGAWAAVNAVPQLEAIVSGMFVSLSQDEYDALVEAGTVEEGKYYLIVGDGE